MDEAAALDDLKQAIYQLNVFADEVGRSLQNGSVRRMTRPHRLSIESDASTVAEAFKIAVRAAVNI